MENPNLPDNSRPQSVTGATPPPRAPQPQQSLYPTASSGIGGAPDEKYSPSYIGLTGSSMVEHKQPMPWGVYLIVGLMLLSFVLSFFNSSQSGFLSTIDMFVGLVISVCLLMRLNWARQVQVALSWVTILLSIATIALLFALQTQINTNTRNYNAAIKRLDLSRLTPSDKQRLASLSTEIKDLQKKTGDKIRQNYVIVSLQIIEGIGFAYYLTRPKVIAAFVPDNTL